MLISRLFWSKSIRPEYRKRKGKSAEWEVTVERPTYDLTIFKLHCGYLTLKIYTKANAYFALRRWRMTSAIWTAGVHWGGSRESFPS